MSLNFARVGIVAALAFGCVVLPSSVQANDARLAKCSTLTDQLIVMIQGSRIDRARRFKARLDSCVRLQGLRIERDLRRIVGQGPR